MQSVTSNAVAEQLEVSELKTLVDNSSWIVKYRTMGKIIIFTIHVKTSGNMSVAFPNFSTVTTGEGLKTALTWGGIFIGEAYVSTNGTGINAQVRYEGEGSFNGSGELVTFLA